MPARSEQQQKLFGLALSVKRGETPRSEASPEILKIVDTMTEKDIEDFAGTKHAGIPKKVEQKLREKIREMLKNETIKENILKDREKQLLNLPKGSKVFGGGYGPYIKTHSNTFVSPKGTKHNSAYIIKLIGGFSDFKIKEDSVNEAKVTKTFHFKGKTVTDIDEIDADFSRQGIKSQPDFNNKMVTVTGDERKIEKIAKFYRGVEESVNEGKKAFKVNPQIGKAKYSISFHDGKSKHKDGSDFWGIETFKNKVDLEKGIKNYKSKGFVQESVNEAATRTAREIGGLTGMNSDFIQKFVDKNELDIEKVFQYVKKGKLKDRMDFVTALSGKPNNPIQKKMIKMFGEAINEADVVGKTVFSDGKGKLVFGYYKDDDGVTLVDYKTWAKLNMKDVSKGDTNKDRVINAILRNQKQFNKKVEYNMWSKKTNPSFEEKMDWFIKNRWISNINKGGIRENVESVNEGKKYKTLDDFEKVAKIGNVFYLGDETQFKRATKNDYYKVVDKKPNGEIVINKGNSKKRYTIGADRYDEPVILVKESVNEDVALSRLNSIQDAREKMISFISYKKANGKNKPDSWYDRTEKSLSNKSYKDLEKLYLNLGGKKIKIESVNEAATRTAREIGGLTGMNSDFIQKFVDTHNLDIEKVFQFVKKGKLKDRMDLVSAIAGKPNNPIQKKMIKMFKESVNENTVVGDVRKKLGSPPKGTDVRDRSGQIYVYFHSKDSKSSKYAERVKELVRNDYRKTAILLDLDKKNESINEANFRGKNWFFTTFSDGDIRGDIKVNKTAIWKLTNAGNSLGIGGQFTLMDAGKMRARAAFPKAGNLSQLAKRMYDVAQKETTYGVDKNIKEKDILDGLRGYYKAWASKSNESVNESIKYKDVKKGDVLYSWIYGSKKGGKQEREYYKVKILEPISDEPGYERFSAKQLDGLRKGKTVVVWLDTLSKKANESVNEAKVELELDLFKNYNQRKPNKTIKVSASTSTPLSKLAKGLKPQLEKGGYDYAELHFGDKFLGSMMAGTDDYSFKKGRGLSGSGFRESANEGKDDYMARYGKTNITLKKGYKHHKENELEDLYNKVGKVLKNLKVKDATLTFETKNETSF